VPNSIGTATIKKTTLESVSDGLVYDLYFEKEMKRANCYITYRIREVVKPFKGDDTDNFKVEERPCTISAVTTKPSIVASFTGEM